MFVKLLKYELKATSRTFLPLYGGLFVLAVITKLFMVLGSRFPHSFAIAIPSALTMFLFMVALIAAFALTFFCLLQRFYKNMTGDEAYFMFTLPVKAPLLIFSKLLVSLLWTAATGLAAAAACFILTLGQGGFSWLSSMFSGLPAATGWLYTLENLLLLLIIAAAQYLMCYACIAVGQLSRHKLLCAVAVYLGASFVSQMVFFIAAVVFASLPNLNWLLNSALNAAWPGAGHVLVGCLAVFHLVFGAIYYFITHLLLTRHLNLE